MLVAVFSMILLLPSIAAGEWFIGGYAGGSLNGDLTSATLPRTPAGDSVHLSDVRLDDSLVFGGKAGYFSESVPWFGLEFDGSAASADVPAQSNVVQIVPMDQRSTQTETRTIAPKAQTLVSLATSMVLRYPGERWQPYAGVGLAIIMLDDLTLAGVGFQAGLRLFVRKPLALFAEYRFRGADFDGLDLSIGQTAGNLGVNQFVGGVSLHFP